MTLEDFFADPTVEEIVATHGFEVVTYHRDGSVRHHDVSEPGPPEGDR